MPRQPILPLAIAALAALAVTAFALPADRSLRAGRDPGTGARVERPRPAPPLAVDDALRHGTYAPQHAGAAADWCTGSYPERVLDELRLSALRRMQGVTVLPTSQSFDRGEIAVIEDDGTILEPVGAQVRIDPAALSRRFLELHDDEYDYLCVWTASNVTNLTLGSGFAYELNVRNEVEGIGLDLFDFGEDFGSGGALRSFVNMGRLSAYPDDPNQTFLGTNTPIEVLAHEAGHRFGAYTYFQAPAGPPNPLLLGRDFQHWSFFMNTLASNLEGNRIKENGGGSFTTIDATNGFTYVDEYLFGLRDSGQVDTLWFVDQTANYDPPGSYGRGTSPQIGVSFTGNKTFVPVSWIVAANGLRVPTPLTSPKTFRMGWVLVIKNGDVPTPADLAKVESFRSAWGPYFAWAVEGLGAMDNTLNSVAGSVSIAHVPLKDTEDTAAPRPIAATMGIRQRSLLIGFDPTSPRLHWRANGGPWSEVPMPNAGGDLYTGTIPGQPAGTIVDYWLSAASDSAGITGALPGAAPAAYFTYRSGPDLTPPVLAHVEPGDPSYLQLPLTVSVDAFDNLGLDSVAVVWRTNDGPEQVAAVPATDDGPYAFAIGAGAGFGDVVTYRFEAVDRASAPNRTRLPAGTAPYALLVGADFAETFENGEGGFTHGALSPGTFDQWHRSNQRNATPGGGWSWKCGETGPGPYGASLHAGLESGPVTIGPNAVLTFRHFYELESSGTPGQAYDGARVEWSEDGGGTWTPLVPDGGYTHVLLAGNPLPAGSGAWSGTSGEFVTATVNLHSTTVRDVRLRWVLGSDGFVGGEGWYVDEVTVAFDGGQPVDVPLVPASFALATPTPNPTRTGRTTLAWSLPTAADMRLTLHDVRGRLVRVLVDGPRPAGPALTDWDGRDDAGRLVPHGLYFARLRAQGLGERTTRIVFVR